MFYISGLTFACGAIFYVIFGSAERQYWGTDAEERDTEKSALLPDGRIDKPD